MKSGAAVILLAVLAGCSNPAPWTDGGTTTTPPPSPLILNVPSGEWVAFEPGLGSDGSFGIHMDRAVDYEGPGIYTQDSFDCAVVNIRGEWLPTSSSERSYGGTFEGKRDALGESWVNLRMGDGHVDSTATVSGTEGPAIAANFQVGNAVSNMTITSEDGGSVLARGRYWCLDGPFLWQGGAYTVTHTSFNASGLEWQVNAEKGLLVRVQTAMSGDLDLAVATPNGTMAALPEGSDLTFCSPQVGLWTFTLSTRVQIVGTSQLTISILDLANTGECQGNWMASPLFGQA